MKKHVIFFFTLLLALCSLITNAQISRTLSYQGVLTDSSGNPKSDGSYTLTFRLYTTSSGGSSIWSEQKTIPTKRGLFSTILGDQTLIPDSVKFDRPYWMSLQVASEPELSPRVPLTAVGYSLYSMKADTAKFAITAPQLPFVDSARIAGTIPDNSITSQKILNGTIQRGDVAVNFTAPYADTASYAKGFPTQGVVDSARIAGTATNAKTLVPGATVSGMVYNNAVVQIANTDSSTGGGYAFYAQNYSHFTWRPAIYGENKGLSAGVYGRADSWHGVVGWNQSNTSAGVWGNNIGSGFGMLGESNHGIGVQGAGGTGVVGRDNINGNYGELGTQYRGVHGLSVNGDGVAGQSTTGYGIYGTSIVNYGLYGRSDSNTAVVGESITGDGVRGSSTNGIGVSGNSDHADGIVGTASADGKSGVYGVTNNSTGYGVYGLNGNGIGVYGASENSSGVYGNSTSGDGVVGSASADGKSGVHGVTNNSTGYGVHGLNGNGVGVFGQSTNSVGIQGASDNDDGVRGEASAAGKSGVYGVTNNSTGYGVHGLNGSGTGVYGQSTNGDGVVGSASAAGKSGIYGVTNNSTGYGVYGLNGSGVGVFGLSDNNVGVYGRTTFDAGSSGVLGEATTTSGYSDGVTGKAHANSSVGGRFNNDGEGIALSVSSNGNTADRATIRVHNNSSTYGMAAYLTNLSGYHTAHFQNSGNGGVLFLQNAGDVNGTGGNDFITAVDNDGGDVQFKVLSSGEVRSDVGFNTPAADFAEMLPAEEGLQAGDVLVIGENGKLILSSEPYQTNVAGVHSTQPGFTGGHPVNGKIDGTIPLAITGIVPAKVTNENGSIKPGDLLVTSSTAGYAMKADKNSPQGSVIGKALEKLESGKGKIKILAVLQ